MFSEPFIVVMLVLFCCGIVALAILLRRESARNPLRERLQSIADVEDDSNAAAAIAQERSPVPPALARLVEIGAGLAGSETDRAKLQRLLVQAGWRWPEAVGLLMLAKFGSGLLLCVLAIWGLVAPGNRFGMSGIAVGLVALFIGTLLPELYVKGRAARRHEALARAMPDALDLMVICAEAGLPFPRILKVVSRELGLSAPVMADELSYTSAELQLLPDRASALRHLAERTRVPVIESMVASLIQAERYGTPLAQALRTIAEESRSRFILELEEKAGKLPAQLSLPLMTLILPPVVALVATPAIVRVIRTLMQ